MAVLDRKTKKQAKQRLKMLEQELGQKIDFKELEKRLDRLDLEKRLGVDLKELGQKIDRKELERRLKREPEPEDSSSAGFIVGLLVGAIIGAALAILFGKGGNREAMDQFAQRAESLRETAADSWQQARGDATDTGGKFGTQFGDAAAKEREVTGDDLVDSVTDTIDSASDDVREAVDEVEDTGSDMIDRTGNQSGQA